MKVKKYNFNKKILSVLEEIKNETYKQGKNFNIPIYQDGKKIALLRPLTKRNLIDNEKNRKMIRLLKEWREVNSKWFDVFKVTEEGTKRWLREQVINAEDRILFWVQTLDGVLIGHMGLYRFDFKNQSCEIDNVIKGKQNIMPGIMTLAQKALMNWSFSKLELRALTLRVFFDNERAIALYHRCGFKKVRDIPLKKVVKGDTIRWVEISDKSDEKPGRYFSQYKLTKSRNNRINNK